MEERKELQKEIQKRNVKIEPKQKSLSLLGPRIYVQEVEALLEKNVSSLYSDILCINKPGAKKFCLNSRDMYSTIAKNKYKCVVHVQQDGEGGITTVEGNLCEPHCQVKLGDGVTIAVYKDDLTRHCVDVVVNAANEDLKHCGGLALALLKAAGPKLQTYCDSIVSKKGRLSVGESVITDAGDLPCKHVIHTVGPRWDSKSQKQCERQLRKSITRSLELAEENGHNSIGIPAVSSGVFGFPLKECVENIVDSIREYLDKQQETGSIKMVHLVSNDTQTVQAFTDALKAEFGGQIIETKTMQVDTRKGDKSDKPRVSVTRANNEVLTTNKGLVIKLVQDNIEDAKTDVIVNSVGLDLNLNNGTASKALFSRAGPRLQNCLDVESQAVPQVTNGTVFKTDGCNLNCDKVLHVVSPHWDHGKGPSEKTLRHIIKTCINITEQLRLKSISFPAIGSGNLGFPKSLAAAILFDEVLDFSSKANPQNLKEIHIVCHPSDAETIKAFSLELTNRQGAGSTHLKSSKTTSGNHSTFSGSVITTALGVHEMKLGSINYQVKTGDITKEKTDVIVNSSNQNFTLQTGVSKAILQAAGPSVLLECALYATQPHKGYIFTKNGSLACKHILHVVGPSNPTHTKSTVLDVLWALEKQKITSVAFPALGTGAGRMSPAAVADAMLDAVSDFASSKSVQYLQVVKVIVFQQHMLNDFYMSMKKKEGTALSEPESFLKKLTSLFVSSKKKTPQKLSAFELMENIEPVILHICGESGESVKKTSLWLQKVILDEQAENVLTDELFAELEEEELNTLRRLQKEFQVSIEYKSQVFSVHISGLTRDVMTVYQKIQYLINNKREKKTLERNADLCRNVVEWSYHDGHKFVPFNKFTNLKLEQTASEKKRTLEVTINGKKYTVHIDKKTATDRSGGTLEIKQIHKLEESSMNLPKHWNQMNKQLEVVAVSPGTQEYTDIQNKFARTCNMTIITIERVQNQHLWLSYQIKQQAMDAKNGKMNNEKQLFHGTAPDTVKQINNNGFNRSFAGKNAAVIGNGTYFAVDARYSAQGVYSRPDANGNKYMYLARVLIGMSCKGKNGMLAPPSKNASDPTDLYDSVTDNTGRPSMYVIFNDIQAYPEYLITFK
ncbi:protein mono-ADP-ribosyltransferase PARP14-like [Discoglossus pictus]